MERELGGGGAVGLGTASVTPDSDVAPWACALLVSSSGVTIADALR